VTVNGTLLDSATRSKFEERAELAFKEKYQQMKFEVIDGKSKVIKANTQFWTRSLGFFTYGTLKGIAKTGADDFPEWPGQ
jgi:hypothetical protein